MIETFDQITTKHYTKLVHEGNEESYGWISDKDGRLDIEFWKRQGDQAIFNAALDMILDYLRIRHGHVDKPRLQKIVESFGKTDWIQSK